MYRAVGDLQALILDSQAVKARTRWDELLRSLTVFVLNADELAALIRDMESNPLAVSPRSSARQLALDGFFMSLDQRLHNMLASAASLIDHSRRLSKAYPETAFQAEYFTRKDAVATLPVASFLKDLRNYLVHYGLVPVALVRSVATPSAGAVATVRIESARLLEWSNWGAASKAFIRAADGGITVLDAVGQYVEAVHALYAWLFRQFSAVHRQHLDEVNGLIDEYNAAVALRDLTEVAPPMQHMHGYQGPGSATAPPPE